jgi:hypothetical protein
MNVVRRCRLDAYGYDTAPVMGSLNREIILWVLKRADLFFNRIIINFWRKILLRTNHRNAVFNMKVADLNPSLRARVSAAVKIFFPRNFTTNVNFCNWKARGMVSRHCTKQSALKNKPVCLKPLFLPTPCLRHQVVSASTDSFGAEEIWWIKLPRRGFANN